MRQGLLGGGVARYCCYTPGILRKSAATRVARQGVPAHVCNYDPEGLERHLDAARQTLPQDNFCHSNAAQLPSPRGANSKEVKKCPLLWGSGNLGGILRDLGEGSCESTIAARQWGVNFYREASRCLAGPSGKGSAQRGFPDLF